VPQGVPTDPTLVKFYLAKKFPEVPAKVIGPSGAVDGGKDPFCETLLLELVPSEIEG